MSPQCFWRDFIADMSHCHRDITVLFAHSVQRSHPARNLCVWIKLAPATTRVRDIAEGGTRLLSAPASPNRLDSASFGRKSSQNGYPGGFPHKKQGINLRERGGKGAEIPPAPPSPLSLGAFRVPPVPARWNRPARPGAGGRAPSRPLLSNSEP